MNPARIPRRAQTASGSVGSVSCDKGSNIGWLGRSSDNTCRLVSYFRWVAARNKAVFSLDTCKDSVQVFGGAHA